ncbi:peptidoglycan-binding protein [Salipaludibacillus agaradhaerens]|uniref:peptidoglycan-binding protein n=1 Tax=Salipaludibacillus agaradhaerens TaxID=76935 RepID=UPI002151FBCB|nr:peptidoglycan-binding protein [Salipaludibacillus agaradhaerens]MCR6108182.1 peptidoglycan-binding protein [Salipaludibacillus agaradhaerens]MCR6120207.1 peptidoglycan-binding protein [Salipaludibacillus agaradhaerens]
MEGRKYLALFISVVIILNYLIPLNISYVKADSPLENESINEELGPKEEMIEVEEDSNAKESDEDKVIVIFNDSIDERLLTESGGEILDVYDNIPAVAVSVPKEEIENLEKNPNVLTVEENDLYDMQQTIDWGIERVEAPQAWDNDVTGKGIKVAVIDSGVNKSHPDLNIAGCYSATNAPTCEDDDGHGTHVAGIIGAQNNDIGVVGVAPDAEIYAARVSNLDNEIWTVDVISAIDWAISQDVDIINLSLGSRQYSSAMEQSITKAYAEEILVVAAAGNDYHDPVRYPAALPNVIAVSATDRYDNLGNYSNIGDEIEVTAPGSAIYSTYLNHSYATLSGTSMASPHVAGVLALLKEAYPDMSRDELRTILVEQAIDLGESGKDDHFGYGLVQAPSIVKVVPDVPANLRIEYVTSESIKLAWDEQNNTSHFKISIDGIGDHDTNNSKYEIEGLSANTNYEIKVRAVNSKGLSEPTTISVLTLIGKIDLYSENISYDEVSLSWEENGDATYYELYRNDQLIYEGGETSFKDEDLLPETTYNYYIFAKNDDNSSERSEEVVVKTLAKPLTEEEQFIYNFQEGLITLGFLEKQADGIIDNETESAIREFQNYYGVQETGEIDETTLTKLKNILDTFFINGGYHESVVELKKNLSNLGFHVSDSPNTAYGPTTERKIKEFQSYYGLVANGIGDEVTLAKIEELLSSSFQNGESHEDVITLKENLSKLGFHVSNNPNTAYGPTTERRVREFQVFYNLRENGIADEVTLAKIEALMNTPMSRGDYRQDVVDLKIKLAEIGFVVSSNPTPQFGPSTEQVVKDFQSYYGLESHGTVDSATLSKIEEVLGSPFRNGRNHEDTITLKENLSRVGFHVSDNPNTAYGPTTERKVKEFQSYYGLVANGIGDEVTLAKIEELLSSSFQNGESHEDVITLKENLSKLGFHVSDNPNMVYGPMTERRVREFQAYYGLVVNGMADELTLAKIEELINSPLSRGDYRQDVVDLKIKLAEIGFVVSSNPTPRFGPSTEQVVKDFQSYYGLSSSGIVNDATLNKIEEILNSPFRNGRNHEDTITLKENLSKLGFHVSDNPNTAYGPTTERKVKEFQSYYGLVANGIGDEVTLAKVTELLSKLFQSGEEQEN